MSGYFKEHVSIGLDTRTRTRGSIENPTFHLNSQITFSQKSSKTYWMRLENTLLPNSFYQIDSNFNVFQVLEDDGAAGDDTITITIDEGNYTITELLTEIETQLDANTMNANDYTLTYDDITNKMTISFTGTSADITIDSIANGSTLNSLLGWGKADTDNITGGDNQQVVLVGAGNAVEAPNCVDLNSKPFIIVKTDISSNNYYNDQSISNVAVRIPISVDRNVREIFSNDNGHKTLLNNKGPLSTITFRFEDPFGNLLDTNECDIQTEVIIYELTEPLKAGNKHPNFHVGIGGGGIRQRR